MAGCIVTPHRFFQKWCRTPSDIAQTSVQIGYFPTLFFMRIFASIKGLFFLSLGISSFHLLMLGSAGQYHHRSPFFPGTLRSFAIRSPGKLAGTLEEMKVVAVPP